jgi:hypothetical protein
VVSLFVEYGILTLNFGDCGQRDSQLIRCQSLQYDALDVVIKTKRPHFLAALFAPPWAGLEADVHRKLATQPRVVPSLVRVLVCLESRLVSHELVPADAGRVPIVQHDPQRSIGRLTIPVPGRPGLARAGSGVLLP